MAKIREINQTEWDAWVASRPESVRRLCQRLPPDRLYRLKTSGHRVTLYAYCEDGTVTVFVGGDYNALSFERKVFGIKPDNLEECDLPSPGEPHGVSLTESDQIEALCAVMRKQPEGQPPMNVRAEPIHVKHA